MYSVSIRSAAALSKFHGSAYTLFCSHRHIPWQKETFNKTLIKPLSVIALINNELAGYVLVSELMGEVEVEDICVSPKYRKQGIAYEMLVHIVELCKSLNSDYILLEVAKNNVSARALYEKMEFETIHVRKNYYKIANEQFDDAILMRKGLKN